MPQVPNEVNGVTIEFAPGVNREVDQKLIDALVHRIPRADQIPLRKYRLWVSSASDSHRWPSRHSETLVVELPMFKAIDISRVDGIKMVLRYGKDPFLTFIVNEIQKRFETYPHRRENFGPLFKRKLGKPSKVSGHKDHIHLSVN